MRTTTMTALAGLLLLAIPSWVGAQTAVLTLTLDENTLETGGERPELSEGVTLAVQIRGDAPPEGFGDDWEFTLDEVPLERMTDNLPAGVRAGYSVPAPAATGGFYTLAFEDAGGNVSMSELQLPVGAPIRRGDAGTASVRSSPSRVCAGPAYDRRNNEVVLVFTDGGLPLDGLPRDVDDNDVIHVCLAIPQDADAGSYVVEVEGTIRDQTVSVLGQGSLGDLPAELQSSVTGRVLHLYGTYGPFSAPSIEITIGQVSDGASSRRSHVLRINTTYVANLQYGVAISNIRFNDFVLGPVPGGAPDDRQIRNRSSEAREARNVLLVGFYGWPWEDEFWNGRDVEETPGNLLDRLGPMVGIGLDDAFEEFVAGLTLEITKGLFLFGAAHVASTTELADGFSEGELLTAPLDAVPVREEWRTDVTWGLSADLRIAASVLKGILGSE